MVRPSLLTHLSAKSVVCHLIPFIGLFSPLFFLSRDEGSLHGAPVAVKTMKKPVSAEAVVAFRQEILITSQLRHPNGKAHQPANTDNHLCYCPAFISRQSSSPIAL